MGKYFSCRNKIDSHSLKGKYIWDISQRREMKDKDIRLDTSEGVLSSGFCVISFPPFPPLSLLPHFSSSPAGCAERRCNGLPQGSHLIGSHCPSRSEMAPTPSAWKKLFEKFTMVNDADFIVGHFPKERLNGYYSTSPTIGGVKINVVSIVKRYQNLVFWCTLLSWSSQCHKI